MKKAIIILLVISMALGMTGCAGMLEDEYLSISEHTYSDTGSNQEQNVTEARNYDDMKNAIIDMITAYREKRTIRFVDYSGDIEKDTSDVCAEIMNETAIGAFATYYVEYTINKFVPYSEAEISVIYKKTKDQVTSIKEPESGFKTEYEMENLLKNRGEYLAFKTQNDDFTKDFILNYLEEIYYANPDLTVVWPEISVTEYPEGGKERIIEIEAEYPYIGSLMGVMKRNVTQKAASYLDEADHTGTYMLLASLCREIKEGATYDDTHMSQSVYSMTDVVNTAYSAFVMGKTSSEGMAMAFKLLCDEENIDCRIVKGKLDNQIHVWNIVKYNGYYYHVDVSDYENVFLKSDKEMMSRYFWDTGGYPKCVAQLNPPEPEGEETDEEAGEEPGEPANPDETDSAPENETPEDETPEEIPEETPGKNAPTEEPAEN